MKAFQDRRDAGRQLAAHFKEYAARPDAIVLALPRGGVPVAYEVALALELPLDVFLVRKLGVPWQEELAMGAIASGGVRILNHYVIETLEISEEEIDKVAAQEQRELERREQFYRNDRPLPELKDRTVILIDDGLATGSTMRAAVLAVRQQGVREVVVAVPVAAIPTCQEFKSLVDHVVCVQTPSRFFAVGYWYEDFSQTTDAEVSELLDAAAIQLVNAARH